MSPMSALALQIVSHHPAVSIKTIACGFVVFATYPPELVDLANSDQDSGGHALLLQSSPPSSSPELRSIFNPISKPARALRRALNSLFSAHARIMQDWDDNDCSREPCAGQTIQFRQYNNVCKPVAAYVSC
jgi:hypothetical protein